MSIKQNSIAYLLISNTLLWGLPLSINHFQETIANNNIQVTHNAVAKSSTPIDDTFNKTLQASVDPLLSPNGLLATNSTEGLPGKGDSAVNITTSPILSSPKKLNTTAISPLSLAIRTTATHRTSPNLLQQLTGADGLGGAITLATLDEPVMPIAARAEQLQWQRSNDVLAPLPLRWREPLRRELGDRIRVSQAATVRLPVRNLSERQELPMIITDEGIAEGLVKPNHPRTREAVENWAARQQRPKPGTVQVLVVAAEPVDTPDSKDNGMMAKASSAEVETTPVATSAPSDPNTIEPQL